MDEQAALALLETLLPSAGDDAAVVDGVAVTIDMLHATTDFPDGTTRYTAGWRAVGASLSDLAAMGAAGAGAVGVYAAPQFIEEELTAFIEGAVDVCEASGTEYVGGDLDEHAEFTVTTAAVGRVESPVWRHGATVGDRICVTGTLGRTAAGMALFDSGQLDRANELFRFRPRLAAGQVLGTYATAMIDASDGLARSVHQIGAASDCGMAIESDALPLDPALTVFEDEPTRQEKAIGFGEDFELVCTVPQEELAAAKAACPVSLTEIGTVTDEGVTLDGEPLPNRGYSHGTTASSTTE